MTDGAGLPGRWLIRKTADESVTSNTTPQADDELLFAIGANEVRTARFVVFFTAATGGDLRFNISGPSGSSGRYGFHGLAVSAASDTSDLRATSDALGSDSAIGGAGATAVTLIIEALVATGATPGNVTFNWSQQSSSGTATVVLADSFLIAERASSGPA